MHSPPAHSAPNLPDLATEFGGIEDAETKFRSWVFDDAVIARKVVKRLGGDLRFPAEFRARQCWLEVRAGKVVASVPVHPSDGDKVPRWTRGMRKRWRCVTHARAYGDSIALTDQYVRVLVCDGRVVGKKILNKRGEWQAEHDNQLIAYYLIAKGFDRQDIPIMLGEAVENAWRLVNIPFAPEFPGNRQWNEGPQYAYQPTTDRPHHPHWDMILKHCGQDLDDALKDLDWARAANIKTGADYLRMWAACMLREPYEKLPYLFFYGEQNSGKSIYHEALAQLMTKGVVAADRALTNANDFNGELANGVLAYIEEKDVAKSNGAYNKLKDWVTSPTIAIRRMRTDQFSQVNTLHFIQCANEREALAIRHGDTRITVLYVPALARGQEIPKSLLMERLKQEAPHIMRTIMDLQLPPLYGRLRLPVVSTGNKASMAADSLPEFVVALVDAMQSRDEWHGTAKGLHELLGEGCWPADAKIVKRDLLAASSYLREQGLVVSTGPHTRQGRLLTIKRAA